MFVRHHFEDDQYICSWASQTLITLHFLRAYYKCYSKITREHKYKGKDNDKDSYKGQDKLPEIPSICYIF